VNDPAGAITRIARVITTGTKDPSISSQGIILARPERRMPMARRIAARVITQKACVEPSRVPW